MNETTDDSKMSRHETEEELPIGRPYKDRFIDKVTVVKTKERITFAAEPFARGYKVHVKIAFDPDDSGQIDQLLLFEKSDVKLALQAFIRNVIEGELGGKLLHD